MDESFPVKRFKSDKMINRATSGSDISKIPDRSTVDHSFHDFTKATCQWNTTIIGKIRGILTRLWNRDHNYCPPIRRKVIKY